MRPELPHSCQELLGTLTGLLLLRQKKNTRLDFLKLELVSPVGLEMSEKKAGGAGWSCTRKAATLREFCWSEIFLGWPMRFCQEENKLEGNKADKPVSS